MRPSNTVDESPTSLRHASPLRSDSIAITIGQNMGDNSRSSISRSPPHNLIKSRSTSRFYTGTMTTSHTTLTVYHTPSSSLFDIFQSARSSPEPWSSPPLSPSSSLQISNSPFASHRGRRSSTQSTSTTGTTSSSSGVTITPSLFAREQSSTTPATTVMADPSVAPVDFEQDPFTFAVFPPPPPRGPKLFFTSAKTGEGVPDIFEYIARRVVRRWEYEERLELRRLHYREPTDENLVDLTFWQKAEERTRTACCGS
ncbi:hypothetical protein H0H93_013469 [Arthromyces matolae]|nr:hypothetical protein H0H93_013469 [Arthromyces matolae]